MRGLLEPDEGRSAGDVRTRPRHVGTASQHCVYAALREFCNFEVRKTRRLAFNPIYAVELAPEVTPEARRWSASQARAFLAATVGDPLGPLFRIVLLRGARRGEAVGLRWADTDLDAGYMRARRPIVIVRGAVTESTPKTKSGDRLIWLDGETVRILKEHRKAQVKARLMAGESWQDNDLIFCQADGTPYKTDAVTRRFQRLAFLVGLQHPERATRHRAQSARLARPCWWRRRTGIEPASDAARRSLVLKTRGTTRKPRRLHV